MSLYEENPAPGVFRWRYLRGALSPFEGVTTPRNYSPCGVTLDRNEPVLSRHPERFYDWISAANIVVPEVLLVPLYLGNKEPLGTLWIVSDKEGHFDAGHARVMTELASFVGIALRRRSARYTSRTARYASHVTGQREQEVLDGLSDGVAVIAARRIDQASADKGLDVAFVHQDVDAADAPATPGTVEARAFGVGRRGARGNPGDGSGGAHLAHRV